MVDISKHQRRMHSLRSGLLSCLMKNRRRRRTGRAVAISNYSEHREGKKWGRNSEKDSIHIICSEREPSSTHHNRVIDIVLLQRLNNIQPIFPVKFNLFYNIFFLAPPFLRRHCKSSDLLHVPLPLNEKRWRHGKKITHTKCYTSTRMVRFSSARRAAPFIEEDMNQDRHLNELEPK